MPKSKILLLGNLGQSSWTSLSNMADFVTSRARCRQEFLAECRQGGLDGVVAIARDFASGSTTGNFDMELIATLPKSVRYICHNGAGYDQIDVAACTVRSIRVSNVPCVIEDATADTTMFLIMGALRQFNPSMTTLRAGDWQSHKRPSLGRDLKGKTLGILGMGGIGQNVRSKAQTFGMNVIYHNRHPLGESMRGEARWVTFEELLQMSDVLSLNCPLNETTYHKISYAELSMTKPGVVIVNTARGAILDEAALVQSLESGQVSSCGLDVFEEEPNVHPGLLAHPRAMLVPHMGAWTLETQTEMMARCIQNLQTALKEDRLLTPVPEQAHLPTGMPDTIAV